LHIVVSFFKENNIKISRTFFDNFYFFFLFHVVFLFFSTFFQHRNLLQYFELGHEIFIMFGGFARGIRFHYVEIDPET